MRKLGIVLLLFSLLSLVPACGKEANSPSENVPNSHHKVEILVSGAASLQEVLTDLAKDYSLKQPDVKVTFNFGSSGALQRQIEQGAPVELFISAGKSQMDELEKKGLLLSGTRLDLLGNELVLVTNKKNNLINGIQDLTSLKGKIGIGTPETVPAGKYAKEALSNLKIWEQLEDNCVLAKDVKQVLTYVETGNVEAGFVYRSDAIGSDKIRIIQSLPVDSHSPIVYPAAIIGGSKNQENAEDFLKFLQSTQAQQKFQEYGFQAIKS